MLRIVTISALRTQPNAMYVQSRKRLIDWLRRQLIGPASEHSLRTSPLDRYPTGVLHPVDPDLSGVDPAAADSEETALLEDLEDATAMDDGSDDPTRAQPARRRRYVPPSSVGFSFFLRGEPRLSVTASAAIYRSNDERDERGRFRLLEHVREELPGAFVNWPDFATTKESRMTIWGGRAGIDVRVRPHRDGRVVTATLYNRLELDPDVRPNMRTRDRVGKSLFEAGLECVIESGDLVEYPRVEPSLLTEEEQEVELQYRDKRIYAIGHGAAANWDANSNRKRIWSEFMPEAEVPMMTVDTDGDDAVLRLERLAAAPMHEELAHFVDRYAGWIDEQERIAAGLRKREERDAARRICTRMRNALSRMRNSVEMLRTDRLATESFRLANRAMLDQMIQADLIAGKEVEPDTYRWRPFQLAFLLTVMVSTIREDDEFRDVLDLIWFPTGGGKTEAYLGLIAFLIIWRRRRFPDSGGGTTALMRYTLRLLTRQQFERAARMVCALELFRRRDPERLGATPIDIGIWVGGEICPNRYDEAKDVVDRIREGRPGARYQLLLERCPWCGTPFDSTHGYRAADDEFQFHCGHRECAFGTDPLPLPCSVVDEALYDRPPSLLIGTIDKFARLAWEERTGAFFGVGNRSRPPELIIQDELHLITGPLGSVAGLYEAGLETLLVRRGVRPKYVASTATIRMAREQVLRLYGRDLAVFPPPGLSHDDMFFARTDRERPGRLYLGFLTPMLDQQHCLAPLATALLTAPHALFESDTDRDALLDAWWTQVVYHGSLKSVGNSHNAFATDIRDRGRTLVDELQHMRESEQLVEFDSLARHPDSLVDRYRNTRIAQLTSRGTAEENARTFERLTNSQGDETCLDVVLATNMVSVGLDVARLAVMIVNGQPLTTAEYIQATSRVGRSAVPGLVLINYYRNQARSLSHYESFRPYHESFYRFVEPSSVTPFTFQVRSRALHAALVIAIRHTCDDLRRNKSAGGFNRESSQVKAAIAELTRRCERAASEGERARDIASHLDRLVGQWHDEARRCEQERRRLNYQTPSTERNSDRLLYTNGEARPGLWATLHSMRNVEGTGALRVRDWPPR
ncbi:MAG: helicase-related protein [Rhodospirillales bacterium]|nr:helicase-related protein [Rhodospirillales bacterium]